MGLGLGLASEFALRARAAIIVSHASYCSSPGEAAGRAPRGLCAALGCPRTRCARALASRSHMMRGHTQPRLRRSASHWSLLGSGVGLGLGFGFGFGFVFGFGFGFGFG